MISSIVESITNLINLINQYRDTRRERINKTIKDTKEYLQNIEQCLNDIIQEHENCRVPTNKWEELRTYSQDLPIKVSHAIERSKVVDLSDKLGRILENEPKISTDLEPLKKLVGLIKASANSIFLPRRLPVRRRTLIYSTLIALSAFSAGWFGRQKSSPLGKYNWKMVSVFRENNEEFYPIIAKVPQDVCDRIRNLTNGNFTIEIDGSEKLNTDEILRDVSSGKIQCGYSGIFYAGVKYKPLLFGCAIPFGLNPQEQIAWLLYRDKDNSELTFMQEIYRKLGLNIIPFPAGGTGKQMGGWFKEEIKSIDDFENIKMRIPGLGAEVLQGFGVISDKMLSGEPIPFNKIKEALEDGTIDAAEWNGPYEDLELGLNFAAKYYYYPAWWEPSATLDIQVNSTAWSGLPTEYREIFKAVCQETYAKTIAEYDQKNSKALEELHKKMKSGEIKVLKFSNEILLKVEEKTEGVLKSNADNDPNFKEVYEKWKEFKGQIKKWSDLEDFSDFEKLFEKIDKNS
jgi:TRAP-type mannitol/chloroaromatic compound transport system substrate-binding protein